MNKTAIMMTCFNRKESTLECLKRLLEANQNYDVYLLDDNSNDGTYLAVEKYYPNVKLIKGTGDLFWNRGMHKAWEMALNFEYEYYIWLNDDVYLYDFAFEELFESSNSYNNEAIVSGVIEEEYTQEVLYGGYDENKKLIKPKGACLNINYLNGNFVLVPKKVVESIGILDPVFHHDLGDVEYGLRALENKVKVISTKKAIGSGLKNNICRMRLNNSNVLGRFRRLQSPLGSNLFINFYFRKKYYGVLNASLFVVFQVFLNSISDKLNLLIFNQKYV